MSKSLTTAKQKLIDLGFDPIEALVEIANNRNQITDIRVKAALALLPYAYTALPTKSEVTLRDGVGVLAVPGQNLSEDGWDATVGEMRKRFEAARAAADVLDSSNVSPINKGQVTH